MLFIIAAFASASMLAQTQEKSANNTFNINDLIRLVKINKDIFPNEATIKYLADLQLLQEKEIRNYDVVQQGTENLDVSGVHGSIVSNQLELTITATKPSIMSINIRQGSVHIKGPIYGTIILNQGTVTIDVDAKNKICPFGFMTGTQLHLKVNKKGIASSAFTTSLGGLVANQYTEEYSGVTNRVYSMTEDEIGYSLGYEGIQYKYIHQSNFVVIDVKAGLSIGAIIGIVVGVVAVIVIVSVCIYCFVCKKKKDSSAGGQV